MSTASSSSLPTSGASGLGSPRPERLLNLTEKREAHEHHVDMILDGQVGRGDGTGKGNAVRLRFFKESTFCPPTTACWFYDKKEHVAYICVGEAVGNNVRDPKADLGAYAKAFTTHEGGHDAWTTRDLEGVNRSAVAAGVSPSALNLGEDARIEHLARVHWKSTFGWNAFEPPPPVEGKQPYSVLNSFIWNEGDRAKVDAHCDGKADPDLIGKVAGFYDRIVAAKRTEDVIPILVEFQKLTPPPPAEPSGGGGSSSSSSASGSQSGAKSEAESKGGSGSKSESEGGSGSKSDAGSKGGPGSKSESEGGAGSKPEPGSKGGSGSKSEAKGGTDSKPESEGGAGSKPEPGSKGGASGSEAGAQGGSGSPGGADGRGASESGSKEAASSGAGGSKGELAKPAGEGSGPGSATGEGAKASTGTSGTGAAPGAGSGPPASCYEWVAVPRAEDLEGARTISGDKAKMEAAIAASTDARAETSRKPGGTKNGSLEGGVGSGPRHEAVDPDASCVAPLSTNPFLVLPSTVPPIIREQWERESRSPRIQRLVQAILPAFAGSEGRRYAEQPTRRLDANRYLGDKDDCWVERTKDGPKRPNRVLILHDCSGSMSGAPAHGGRDLVFVANELTRRGKIEGHVVYHKICQGRLYVQTLKLPVPAVMAGSNNPNGGAEGIAPALDRVQKIAKEADLVAIYTDANICDAPTDKHRLHAQGIWTYGVYAGAPEACPKLREYTDYAVRGGTIDETIKLFAAEIQRRGLKKRR